MYEEFFGLNCSPFQLSPDPSFLYSSERSRDAIASISEAIRQRKGFIVMTGEVGTGKTLVLRCLVESWERDEIPFAYFIGPRLSTIDFLSYITCELGISTPEPTKGNLLRALYEFLLAQFEKGLTTILVIDEAHQMPRSVLEEVRVLANFETAQQKLIQIVLVGQPELDKKLDSVELRSLKQRIAVRCRLEPLHGDEIRHYIERRLELAGAETQASTIFPPEAIKLISRYSQGIPRLINSICDQGLILAHGRAVRVVAPELIAEVAAQFRLDPGPYLRKPEKHLSVMAPMERASEKPQEPAAPAKADLNIPDSTQNNVVEPSLLDALPAKTGFSVVQEPARASGLSADYKPYELTRALASRSANVPPASASAEQPTEKAADTSEAWPFMLRRWLKPGFRLTLIVICAVIAPVSLAMGMFMARRQKTRVREPHQSVASRQVFPVENTTASVQPVAASLLQPDPISAGHTARSLPTAALKSTETEDVAPRQKIAMPAFSKPMLRSSVRSGSLDPPQIGGTQAKDLEISKGVSGFTPSLPKPPEMSHAGEPLRPAKLVSGPAPVYPMAARLTNTQGTVIIDAVVNQAGKVTDMQVVSGPTLLTMAAMDALRTWQYEPARLDGQPVASHVQVKINFK